MESNNQDKKLRIEMTPTLVGAVQYANKLHLTKDDIVAILPPGKNEEYTLVYYY